MNSSGRPKVVATLACRVQSKRLYGKPLQLIDLDQEISILEYLTGFLQTCRGIDDIVLAISDGEENYPFRRLAEKLKLPYVVGSEDDVQMRLIMAAAAVNGEIIYRVTTECPFIYMDTFEETLKSHIENGAALTVIENLPEGCYYELITLADLKTAHRLGEPRHRSEFCTLFIFENPDRFRVQRLTPEAALRRPEIRLTVDYPEDLIVVREVHKALKRPGTYIAVPEIIEYMDAHPELKQLNGGIQAGAGRIWN